MSQPVERTRPLAGKRVMVLIYRRIGGVTKGNLIVKVKR